MNTHEPNFEPLFNALGKDVSSDFMWMYSTAFGGTFINAYKHCDTRRYLFIGDDNQFYKYLGESDEQKYEVRDRDFALKHAYS